MAKAPKKGFLGGIKDGALSLGILVADEDEEGDDESFPAETQPAAAAAPLNASEVPAEVNASLVAQIRSIALAPENSPLMNTFMRDLEKARKFESDPIQAVRMALEFSGVPAADLIGEIEKPVAANLAGHKMNFSDEVSEKRTAIEARYAKRQQELAEAIAEDQAAAEEIRKRLSANTAEHASLASKQSGELADVDRTENEANASLAVVESEIDSLLQSLKSA